MFADDLKLYGTSDTPESRKLLQDDLCNLEDWSTKWQLPFNVAKCKVLHFGPKNPHHTYKMFGRDLNSSAQERDLGVLFDGTLRLHSQAAAAAARGNKLLGVVRRSFASRSKASMCLLFKTLIRPHLEYANVVWGPSFRGDQKLLERVQRRASKLVPAIRSKPYQERLRELGLPSLSFRRIRGDMITIYQILHGNLEVVENLLEVSANQRTRGHSLKLNISRARTMPRRQFLSVRAAHAWNGLPESVISAPNLTTFKSRLDSHWGNIQHLPVYANLYQSSQV